MLHIKNLDVFFNIKGPKGPSILRAISDVTLEIKEGDCVGLVGESGSGKSTIGRSVLGLNHVSGGTITFNGENITSPDRGVERRLRKQAQMVFQDPHSSLNPRLTIFKSVAEPLVIHTEMRGKELSNRVSELLEIVGLQQQFLYRYPHELSGGQKQRVCIARAIALNPKLLILDEPTSALDVSVQAQILEFLKSIQKDLGLTYLFISHDLAVIRHMCTKVAVLYLGRILEEGPVDKIFDNPQHPYTRALLDSVPLPEAHQEKGFKTLKGEIPSPINLPPGCAFFSRCEQAQPGKCNSGSIDLKRVGSDQQVRCVLSNDYQ